MFEHSDSDAQKMQEGREIEETARSLALSAFGRKLRALLNADRYEHYYQTINEGKHHANYHA